MARTSRAERKRRREAALKLVAAGMSFSDSVTAMERDWGISRSSGRRDVSWALDELGNNLDAIQVQQLVTHLCTSAQRIALAAEQHHQYGSAIAANKFLYELLLRRRLDLDAKKAERRGSYRG